MPYDVDLSGLFAMRSRLQSAITEVPQMTADCVDEVANYAVDQLHDRAPYDGDSNNGTLPEAPGHLVDSFSNDPQANPGLDSETTVKTSQPIKLQYVTKGTDSPIFPTFRMAMWWPDAPHPLYAVNGQQANDFVSPIYSDIDSQIADIVDPVIADWLNTLG